MGSNTNNEDKIIHDVENIREIDRQLAEYTMECDWEKVVELYRSNGEAHTSKIIGYDERTALHVALDKNEQEVAEVLLKEILKRSWTEKDNPLKMKDESGNTPLHVAASKGFVGVCKLIVGKDEERKELVRKKNKKGETPLFVAALNWNRKRDVNKCTVAYLIHVHGDNFTIDDLVRDHDGDSILHSAIRNQYFDLAIIILHYYDSLCVHTNKKGITPLKALAAVPSAFRSATDISGWKLILYHCIIAVPTDPESAIRSYLEPANDMVPHLVMKSPENNKYFPKNYSTLVSFLDHFIWWGGRRFISLLRIVQVIFDTLVLVKEDKEDDNAGSVDNIEIGASKPEEKYDYGWLPPNYVTLRQFINAAIRGFVGFYGLGALGYDDVQMKKMKHKCSHQVLKLLLKRPYAAYYGYGGKPTDDFDQAIYRAYYDQDNDQHQSYNQGRVGESSGSKGTSAQGDAGESSGSKGTSPQGDGGESSGSKGSRPEGDGGGKKAGSRKEEEKSELAFVTAVRNGIVEMVNEILQVIPSAIYDKSWEKENVFWVAVRNRQPFVIEELKRHRNADRILEDFISGAVDGEDNILHLAAHGIAEDQPGQIAGVALQMMWDTNWYEYIKEQVPQHYEFLLSKEDEKGSQKTPMQIFKANHKGLIEKGSEWLKDTSESCSVVATLIAGVSFATACTVPGGNGEKGASPFEDKPAFNAFAMSSLIGLCFSVTALTMFLSILTSPKEPRDFRKSLPKKLLVGLSALFISIVSMFVSFCSGHYFLMDKSFQGILFLLYGATVFPVIFFAVAQLPLYYDLLETFLTRVPNKGKGLGTSL